MGQWQRDRRAAEVLEGDQYWRFSISTFSSLTDTRNVAHLCATAFLCGSAVKQGYPFPRAKEPQANSDPITTTCTT